MAPPRMPEAVIGLDVGKSSHWACVATRDGEILLSAPVANREGDLDSLFGRFPDVGLSSSFSGGAGDGMQKKLYNRMLEIWMSENN